MCEILILSRYARQTRCLSFLILVPTDWTVQTFCGVVGATTVLTFCTWLATITSSTCTAHGTFGAFVETGVSSWTKQTRHLRISPTAVLSRATITALSAGLITKHSRNARCTFGTSTFGCKSCATFQTTSSCHGCVAVTTGVTIDTTRPNLNTEHSCITFCTFDASFD